MQSIRKRGSDISAKMFSFALCLSKQDMNSVESPRDFGRGWVSFILPLWERGPESVEDLLRNTEGVSPKKYKFVGRIFWRNI